MQKLSQNHAKQRPQQFCAGGVSMVQNLLLLGKTTHPQPDTDGLKQGHGF
jgi:hypothetical protein